MGNMMRQKLIVMLLFIMIGGFALLMHQRSLVLSDIPATGTLELGEEVFSENDGRCSTDEIIKVTGGSFKKAISRTYECVDRP